jgi:hypothetical protein
MTTLVDCNLSSPRRRRCPIALSPPKTFVKLCALLIAADIKNSFAALSPKKKGKFNYFFLFENHLGTLSDQRPKIGDAFLLSPPQSQLLLNDLSAIKVLLLLPLYLLEIAVVIKGGERWKVFYLSPVLSPF